MDSSSDQSLLQILFEEAPYGVLVTNPTDQSIRANRSFARLLGYEPSELTGKSLADITPRPERWSLRPGAESGDRGEVVRRRRYCTKDRRVMLVRERTTTNRASSAHYVVSRVEWAVLHHDDPLERLSWRESQVLRLVVAGHSSKSIAALLRISAPSVNTYRSRIMVKLNLRGLPDLVRFAIEQGVEGSAGTAFAPADRRRAARVLAR